MRLSLYVVNGSHPCETVRKALDLKRLEYRTIEWPVVLHAPIQRALFGARTVPSLRINGSEKISGSRQILSRLEQLAPDPPLFPSDPARRAEVNEVEEWGDRAFQPVGRTLLWAACRHNTAAMVSYTEGSRIPLPAAAVRASAPLFARAGARVNRTGDEPARRALRELPDQLDRIDGYIGSGKIGDPDHPNAADLQVASTVRLLMTLDDLRAQIEPRPCGALALALFPTWPGQMPTGSLPRL
jgi:glutathione S-transferase